MMADPVERRATTARLLRERCLDCGHPTQYQKADGSIHPTHIGDACRFRNCPCPEAPPQGKDVAAERKSW